MLHLLLLNAINKCIICYIHAAEMIPRVLVIYVPCYICILNMLETNKIIASNDVLSCYQFALHFKSKSWFTTFLIYCCYIKFYDLLLYVFSSATFLILFLFSSALLIPFWFCFKILVHNLTIPFQFLKCYHQLNVLLLINTKDATFYELATCTSLWSKMWRNFMLLFPFSLLLHLFSFWASFVQNICTFASTAHFRCSKCKNELLSCFRNMRHATYCVLLCYIRATKILHKNLQFATYIFSIFLFCE